MPSWDDIALGLVIAYLLIIYFTIVWAKIESRLDRSEKYISGIMTEEGPNEWLDKHQEKFLSWEEASEQTLWQLEHKKP